MNKGEETDRPEWNVQGERSTQSGKSKEKVERAKYHEAVCTEETRNIDNLLERYEEEKEEIVDTFYRDPDALYEKMWGKEGLLSFDNSCLCNVGNNNVRTPFTCAQCRTLGRLMDYRTSGIGQPFLIEAGCKAGRTAMVVISQGVEGELFLRWDPSVDERSRLFVASHPGLLSCGTPSLEGIRNMTADSLSSSILVSWLVERTLRDKGVPHYVRLYTGFVCRQNGYLLLDHPLLGDMRELMENGTIKATTARSILVQLLSCLRALGEINFAHGAPSARHLYFSREACSYRYEGVHVKGSFTLLLGGFLHSSVTSGSVHLFPQTVRERLAVDNSVFAPQVRKITSTMSSCSLKDDTVCTPSSFTTYRLTTDNANLYNYIRHSGVPLFLGSFDLYCFVVSLMAFEPFYSSVKGDEELDRLWRMMWLQEELSSVERNIQSFHRGKSNDEIPTSSSTVDIIKGFTLRCDVLSLLWNALPRS